MAVVVGIIVAIVIVVVGVLIWLLAGPAITPCAKYPPATAWKCIFDSKTGVQLDSSTSLTLDQVKSIDDARKALSDPSGILLARKGMIYSKTTDPALVVNGSKAVYDAIVKYTGIKTLDGTWLGVLFRGDACLNDGTRASPTGPCVCKAGFSGPRCETTAGDACLNGGTRASPTGPCVCKAGFSGPRCETTAGVATQWKGIVESARSNLTADLKEIEEVNVAFRELAHTDPLGDFAKFYRGDNLNLARDLVLRLGGENKLAGDSLYVPLVGVRAQDCEWCTDNIAMDSIQPTTGRNSKVSHKQWGLGGNEIHRMSADYTYFWPYAQARAAGEAECVKACDRNTSCKSIRVATAPNNRGLTECLFYDSIPTSFEPNQDWSTIVKQ